MVSIKSLTTGYRDGNRTKCVSTSLTATLFPGEITCLLGPNGAGKSTLLKTLSGFLKPVSGEIFIQGESLYKLSSDALSKKIGVVLTERPDLPNMTAQELVALGRSPYTGFWGRLSADDKLAVQNALSMVAISDLSERRVASLSDGERQKVMIAKALAQDTPLIFLDEPTAFLDYPSKIEIMRLLRSIAARHQKTIFLSTHDLEIALQIADRLWLLDKTHGLTTGSPEELSLNNSLGEYFNRPGVCYDPSGRLFRIER